MAKQLLIDIKAVDNLSPQVRAMVGNMLVMGDASVQAEKKASTSFERIVKSALSLKGLLVGLAATIGAGFGVRAAWAGLNDAAAQMDHIGDEAGRLGIAVEQLSSLKYTADIANVSFESLADGIFKAQRGIGEFTTTGGGKASEALKLLNVQLRDSAGHIRQMDELLPEFVDSLNAIPDTNRRNFLAAKIFGDGPEFIRLLAEGGARLRAINQEARALGVVFSPEQIAVANAFRDSIDRVRNAWFGLRAAVLVRVGPDLTEILNRAASAIAAAPQVAGTLVHNIAAAFGTGPESAEAAGKLQAWVESMGGVVVSSLKLAAVGIMAGGLAIFRIVIDVIGRDAMERITKWSAFTGETYLKGVANGIKGHPMIEEAFGATFDKINEQSKSVNDRVKELAGSFTSDVAPAVAAAMAMVRGEVAKAAGDFAAATDALTGLSAAMANTRINTLPDRFKAKPGGAPEEKLDWMRGAIQGFEEFKLKADDAFGFARQAAGQLAESGVDGLTTALVDAASGVKSLGAAFQQFGQQTLRMLSEMITKMLIFRLISGIAGSFAGGVPQLAGDESDFFANRGGIAPQRFAGGGLVRAMLTPGEAILPPGSFDPSWLHAANKMARGGMLVPGPDVNADIVPALLRPGTGVLTRSAVSRMARGGLAGDAGGGISSGGGGWGGVNVVNNFHINGGGTPSSETLAMLKKAAMDGVREGLRNHPGMREQIREIARG